MNTVRVNAYAKLNLTLDITGAEGGFHMLDSLVVTVNLFDRIVVKKRRDGLVNVFMHGMGSESIPPEENNAYRAGERFVERFQTTGADITVYKNIPVGAGMGGSSADAAGVLNALARLYAIADMGALKELADSLGSDTGYLLTGGYARMRGRGEKIEEIAGMPELNFFALVPMSGVNTAECYRKYDELHAGMPATEGASSDMPRTQRVIDDLKSGNAAWAAAAMGNALFPAARELNREVYEAYLSVREFSPMGAFMTGSGSGCCGVFETRELCEWAKSRYRGRCRAYVLKSVIPKRKKGGLRNPFALGQEE